MTIEGTEGYDDSEEGTLKRQLAWANQIINERETYIRNLLMQKENLSIHCTNLASECNTRIKDDKENKKVIETLNHLVDSQRAYEKELTEKNSLLLRRIDNLEIALKDIRNYYSTEYREGEKAYQAVIIASQALKENI